MKLYRVSIGHTEVFAAGIDAEDVYKRRESIDHTFAYLPIVIEEVKIEGYEITVNRIAGDTVETMSRDQLKQYLTEKHIDFVPQWGDNKLREVAIANGERTLGVQ